MKNRFFLYAILLFLSACNCGGYIEQHLLYNSQASLFINDPVKDPDIFFSTSTDTFPCNANMLGLYYSITDSMTESTEEKGGICFSKKMKVEIVHQNSLQTMTVFSDQPFLTKVPGESLNEFFLCANNNTSVPQGLNEHNFSKLEHSFILLLKPDIGITDNSNARFMTEIKLSDRILYDTTQVILFQ